MKSYACLIIAFLFSSFSFAQLSINGGINYNSVESDVLTNSESFWGYNVGLAVQFYFGSKNERVSVICETKLNRKGYILNLGNTKHDFGLNYFSIPLLFNYNFNKSVSVQIGPEFSRLVSGISKNSTDIFNEFDWAIAGGFTFFDNETLSLQLRYTHGITPILSYYSFDDLGNTKSFNDIYNTSILIGIKIKIISGKFKFFK